MTYNSLVSKRFATYQFNIALLDNCTNVSLNTKEIKHHLSTSKQSHTCKNWRYELLLYQFMFGWLLTVRSKRFIIRCLVFIKDTYLYFLTMWVVHKGLYTNNQEHSEMKYPMFEVWTIGTTNPSKSLPDKHFIPYQIHCVVLCLCVECLGSHWQQKEISSWAMVHIQ